MLHNIISFANGFISVNADFSFLANCKMEIWKGKKKKEKKKQMHLKHEKNYLYDKNIFRFSKHKTEQKCSFYAFWRCYC